MLDTFAGNAPYSTRNQRTASATARAEVKPYRWSSGLLPRCFRALVYPILRNAGRIAVWLRIENGEILRDLDGPVILAVNHQSDIDTPVVLAALPRPRRYRVAPTISHACFTAETPLGRVLKTLHYWVLVLFGNCLTLPRGIDLVISVRHMAWLVERKWSILIFPEGELSESDDLLPFEAGVGMLAAHLRLPVVPVWIKGTRRVLNRSSKMVRPGPVLVRFGPPLWLEGNDYRALTRQVEQAIHALKD
jgi:long-chain acyl-CoA synthetase